MLLLLRLLELVFSSFHFVPIDSAASTVFIVAKRVLKCPAVAHIDRVDFISFDSTTWYIPRCPETTSFLNELMSTFFFVVFVFLTNYRA